MIPRNEYPRPQMVRDGWRNLNGTWQFQFDHGRSGRNRGVQNLQKLESTITVPFCPESKLSGVEYKDFIGAVWYKRSFCLAEEELKGRVLLHFEAVNYYCQIWVNGQELGIHRGGYTPFGYDISGKVKLGENTVVLYVENDVRDPLQPRGKQSEVYNSRGCDYTRNTGIWQTVWLEFVPETYIEKYRCIPDADNGSVSMQVFFAGDPCKGMLQAHVSYQGKTVGSACVQAGSNCVSFSVSLSERHYWEPGKPELYDVALSSQFENGAMDEVKGYFGLRSVSLGKNAVLINGKPVFQRLVLDQGYYSEGIYTAPSDEILRRDIELSMALGFNGARMHEKVFERRYLYWADKLGYLVWGEYGNWGLDVSRAEALKSYLEPWIDAVDRDFNSPALVCWCPFNETWDRDGRKQDGGVLSGVYYTTKAIDPTRPCIDSSGHYHVVTDIFDIHDYEQDVEVFRSHYAPMAEGGKVYNNFPNRQHYGGEPYMVTEYGGILWSDSGEKGWGYGNAPTTVEEFAQRYVGLTQVLLENPQICGFCYTQLYDVEQEKNGLYTYGRERKFSQEIYGRLKNAMTARAAIEK